MASSLEIGAVRDALAMQLATIEGLFIYKYWTNTPTIFPCVILQFPEEIDYAMTFRGAAQFDINLMVVVGRMTEVNQILLEQYMSPGGEKSIRACLHADQTLGGEVSQLKALRTVSGLYQIQAGQERMLGAEIELQIKG